VAVPEKPLECLFFKADTGNEPVRDWLKNDVPPNVRKHVGGDILAVQWGWPVGPPLVDCSFGDGLCEVRSNVAGEKYRVLFCITDGAMVVLHGFHKKTKKTPKADVDLARTRQATLKTRRQQAKKTKKTK